MSVLLRGRTVLPRALGWVPLLIGAAVASAVESTAGQQTTASGLVGFGLKWPNDVVVTHPHETRKLGGLLVEALAPDVFVAGIGLNVTTPREVLPVPTASSLAHEFPEVSWDRELLIGNVIAELLERWVGFGEGSDESDIWPGDQANVREVRRRMTTLGRAVSVSLPDGSSLTGEAVDLDPGGRLVLRDVTGSRHALAVGDVVHVRDARISAG